MALNLMDLKPYTSVMLCRASGRRAGNKLVKELRDGIEDMLDLDKPHGDRSLVAHFGPVRDKGLNVGFVHYQERRSPGWTIGTDLVDVLNQLVLVCSRYGLVAIFLTDPGIRSQIVRRFEKGQAGLALTAIEPGTLNAAFAQGPARTLWLAGIHTRTSLKADSKVLSGTDLRDALDPLGDQSYYFTAARCVTDLGIREAAVGLSPRHSKVWIGASRSWRDFRDSVNAILTCLYDVEKKSRVDETPIPVLATPVTDIDDVRKAYYMSVIAPEVAVEEQDEETRRIHERWAYDGKFDIVSSGGLDLVAETYLGPTRLGKLSLKIDTSDPKRIQYDITAAPRPGMETELEQAVQLCGNRRWLQVKYESGHTLSEGMFYISQFRDVQFENWAFPDFTEFDIRKEKPLKKGKKGDVFAPELVGRGDSLFCWVWNKWPNLGGTGGQRGWLANDDGAGEKADFIHFDETAKPPVLTLIHVKGSHSSAMDRTISVSDYEVVTAQAMKNLRFLDTRLLGHGLGQVMRDRVGKLVKHNGVPKSERKGMLTALTKASANYRRRVVIVQPRLSKSELFAARADKKAKKTSGRVARLLQLETLLVGAQDACRDLGAEFQVVADGTIK